MHASLVVWLMPSQSYWSPTVDNTFMFVSEFTATLTYLTISKSNDLIYHQYPVVFNPYSPELSVDIVFHINLEMLVQFLLSFT